MVAQLNNQDAMRSGTGICLAFPENLKMNGFNRPLVQLARATSNFAAFAVAPAGVVVNVGRAGKSAIQALKIRGQAHQLVRYNQLIGNLKSNIAFAVLDTAVSVSLFFLSWKVLAVVFIVRQIKPDYAIIAYKKFTVLVTEGWRSRQVIEEYARNRQQENNESQPGHTGY